MEGNYQTAGWFFDMELKKIWTISGLWQNSVQVEKQQKHIRATE